MYYVWQVNRTPYTHFIDKSLTYSKQLIIIKLYPITHLVISTQGPALAIITLCLGTHRQSNIQHTLSVYCHLMGFHLYNLLVGRGGLEPPLSRGTGFTVRGDTNYALPTQIFDFV